MSANDETFSPSHTLYVKNLNDAIKQEPLREGLYTAFTQHGKVMEIVSSKARKLRGQAWIVFDSVQEATTAMRQLQGTLLFDKKLVIQYAKSKSDFIAKREGTFKPREKRQREEKKNTSIASGGTTKSTNASKKQLKLSSIQNEPNKILFLERLPESCTEEMLRVLFQQYHGFIEIRTVPGKKDIAFVEFQDEIQAGIALQGLYGFNLPNNDKLHVNFAKK